MKETAKGSLTIFAVLSIMLIAAFLFALLEAGRMHQIRVVANMNTESVLESVFANYARPMWENGRLLVLDNGCTEEQGAFAAWEWYAKALSEENVSSGSRLLGSNHLKMSVEQITFEEYRLLTDDDGKVYVSAVSQYMKENLTETVVNQIMSQYQTLQNMSASETLDSSAITNADQAIEEANQQALADGKEDTDENGEAESGEGSRVEMEENPLWIVKSIWTTGVLNLVLKDTKSVSKEKISLSNAVSKRSLKKGTAQISVQTGLLDMVLLSQYLVDYFACYTQGNATGKIQYELEYLLCGKDKDVDNLRLTMERLLAVRVAANMIALATDYQKQGIAYSAALTLVGATANPAIIFAVKSGLLWAWALAEGILDLRTLLSGGKIAVIKNSTQWTSDLLHLGSAFAAFGQAVDCPNGLSYQQYLGYLLTVNAKNSAYRAMDLQEMAIRSMDGYQDFYMDNMVTDAKLSVDYGYRTVFWGMEDITSRRERKFTISTQAKLSYRKAGV
jgi:hypothetical protein